MKLILALSAVFLTSCAHRTVYHSSEPIVAAIYVANALILHEKPNDCDAKCKEEIKAVQASIKRQIKEESIHKK
jgi:Skp family chaperone for outer membrane proteins